MEHNASSHSRTPYRGILLLQPVPPGNMLSATSWANLRKNASYGWQNEQAIMSPEWSIHAAAGTSNYMFIWGMAGENLDYGDMDKIKYTEMK